MDIRGLGYIGIDVTDIEKWRTYGELIGMMVAGDETGLWMRSDERPFRVLVNASDGSDGLAFAGWELPDGDSLECAKAELAAAGITTETAATDQCDQRHVRDSSERRTQTALRSSCSTVRFTTTSSSSHRRASAGS